MTIISLMLTPNARQSMLLHIFGMKNGKKKEEEEARQVFNLFQEPLKQPPLGFSIAEEKIRQF